VDREPLDGIAAADAHLGRPFPLPAAALPLLRWVDVATVGGGVEVSWNLDDSRDGAPGRIALYAGAEPPPARALPGAGAVETRGGIEWRRAALPEAQPSLRPVCELRWSAGGLHLRLTAQGPWPDAALEAIAASIEIGSGA
jgi:hypothetical protein